MVLLSAINRLITKYKVNGYKLKEAINSVLEIKPRLRQKYKQPDPSYDRLYQSEVIHPLNDEANCAAVYGDNLLKLRLRSRRAEDENNLVIYYGLITSANQLIKNALVRDTLAAKKDVLYFKME